MSGLITFVFVVGLLFFCGLCYFGVRRDRAPWSILAIFAFAALGTAAQAYLFDLARLWSGHASEQNAIGIEAIIAMVFVAWRHRGWIGEGRIPRRAPRMDHAIGREHARR
jgi:hypothetical protein